MYFSPEKLAEANRMQDSNIAAWRDEVARRKARREEAEAEPRPLTPLVARRHVGPQRRAPAPATAEG